MRRTEAFEQPSLDAARRWQFRPPDQAPATTLIGFNIALARRPVPGGPVRNIPTWASAYVNRAIRDRWGTPSLTLVPPAAMRTATGVLLDVSIDGRGTPTSACALGPVGELTVPALQAVLSWRFMGRSDGTRRAQMMSLHFLKSAMKVKDVKPTYTADAMHLKIQGQVLVEVLIGVDGLVHDAVVKQSLPGLDESALEAVRQWEFTPALRDGVPVERRVMVTCAFRLR